MNKTLIIGNIIAIAGSLPVSTVQALSVKSYDTNMTNATVNHLLLKMKIQIKIHDSLKQHQIKIL